jgi:hypothetical protein
MLGFKLNLASLPDNIDYAIIEMGMNHSGEITPMTQILKPDIAIITAIESVHQANFNSIDDIVGNNFIIKPIIGTLGKNILHLLNRVKEPNFSYKTYATTGEFLKSMDVDFREFRKFKEDAIFQNNDPMNGYCIQRACMSSQYEIYMIYGVVNSNSDVYFTRAASAMWKNSKTYIGSSKRFYNEIPENTFIRNLVKTEKIRNASFALQLIRMEDGLLYPIDWNFRIVLRPPKINNRIEELYKQLCHMYDVENDLPETWPDIWYMNHSPKKYNQIK